MNTTIHSSPFRPQPRGVALVIVLSMLVLLSALLVAFMTTASTERQAAFANAGVTSARQLADSTVSLVISQIREATSGTDEFTTWASQPGAIRTFSGKLNGNKKTLDAGAYYDGYTPGTNDLVFKLYSSDNMTVTSQKYVDADLPEEVAVIDKWDALKPNSNTKDYADLNQPLLTVRKDLDSKGTTVEPHYPIVDPRARLDFNNADVGADPGLVEGFDAKITNDKTLKMPATQNGGASASVPYVPMPVKWLYVLRDGTIGPASLGTEANPIVGRTAFWTDDETCKLNINTASEGTYWDSPLCSTTQESGNHSGNTGALSPVGNFSLYLATSQPAHGEIMRYPGHPATTCLSPVFGQLLSATAAGRLVPVNAAKGKGTWTYPWLGTAINIPYRDFKNTLYTMLPYMASYSTSFQGTSWSATRNTDVDVDDLGKLAIKTKHLYTSPDEMLFKSTKTTGAAADLNTPLTAEGLEKTRFFLTATSRAPELNLFSRPRVTLWPISAGYKYRTSSDDLFLFTSTIYKDANAIGTSDKRFCFLRWDATSSIFDYTGQWSASPRSVASANDTNQNVKMYEYLQDMTSRPIPGFSSDSFLKKWPAGSGPLAIPGVTDRDQILTMIFDYVRSVNLVDTGTASKSTNVFVPYTPLFYGTKKDVTYDPRNSRSYDWSGQVTPIRINNTHGQGRFITPVEVALVFYGTSAATPKTIRCALVMEMATPMAGFPGLRETYFTKVFPAKDNPRKTKLKVGADANATAVPINLCENPAGLINVVNMSSHEIGYGRAFMPTMGFRNQMHWFTEWTKPTLMQNPPEADDPARPAASNPDFTSHTKVFRNDSQDSVTYKRGATVQVYPYVSNAIQVPANATKMTLEAGNFDIEIWSGEAPDDKRATLVQTVHIDFPAAGVELPIPTSTVDFPARFNQALDQSDWDQNIRGGDVVRSMELTCGKDPGNAASAASAGDMRLAMVRADVPKDYFQPRDGAAAYKTNVAAIHGLQMGHGEAYPTGYTGQGRLAANGGTERKPAILPKLTNGVQRSDGGPGDFDKGISKHTDGAFFNKVDEGNLRYDYARSSPQSIPYYLGRSIEETGQTFFSPNRQLASGVMLGSIPTGAARNLPWQTLLFRPSREAGKTHPGADISQGPPDHLLLDLFHNPVVEPYAISEPFSTAGKVNMNYVIAPFGYAAGDAGNNTDTKNPRSYLRRDTALRGVLKSEFIMAVPTGATECGHRESPLDEPANFRFPIFVSKTLEALETRLKAKDGQYPLFRSASEICTVDLYPHLSTTTLATTVTDWDKYWNTTNALTGDNGRERPYSHIYPRLTTKSNVYTVHMRTQAIRKSRTSKPNEFDPEKDSVVGEYRGSATIERFIDPNDEALKNYDEKKDKVDLYYRYRIVNTKHFAPK